MIDDNTTTAELDSAIDNGNPAAKREAILRGYHPEAVRMNKRTEAPAKDGRLEYWSDGKKRAVVLRTNPESNDRLAEYDLIGFGSPGRARQAWTRYLAAESQR